MRRLSPKYLLDLLSKLASWCQNKGLALKLREIDALKGTNGKGGSLSCSRLGLRNHIVILIKE